MTPFQSSSYCTSQSGQGLDLHARQGEESIGRAQALLALILLLFHLYSATSSMDFPCLIVVALVGILFFSSIVRVFLAKRKSTENISFCLLNIMDAGILVATIWSYSLAYGLPFEAASKSPSTALLFAFVGLRALRFNSRGVIVSGVAIVAWWAGMLAWSVIAVGAPNFASDYKDHLTSNSMLIGAEIERLIALAFLTAGIALGGSRALANTGRLEQANREVADVSKQLAQQTELWRFQAQLLDIVARNQDTEVTANQVCEVIEASVGSGTCMVMKRTGSTLRPFSAPNAGRTWTELLVGLPVQDLHGSCGTAVARESPQFVSDTRQDPRWQLYAEVAMEHNIRACWSHPTAGPSGEIHGTVSLSFSIVRQSNEYEQDLLRIAAYFLGSLMERDLHYEKNISMQAELKAAESASEQTKSFLATMSHEIRTPMNGVLGALDLIQTAETAEERRALLATATESSESLLRLINDILDISRMDAEGVSLNNEPGSLGHVVGSVVRSLSSVARQKGLRLRAETEGFSDVIHSFDELRLRQVLNNIIGNAIKFTTSGEVCASASILEESAEESLVQITVTDTGNGISEEQLETIFDRFKVVDSSYSRTTEGTGLGLSISRQIVEAMGGQIEVESSLGKGTTFKFAVTLSKVEYGTQSIKVGDDPVCDCRSLKILIAEDNDTNAMIGISMLKKSGHDVTRASNGQEAVMLANSQPFDVILMDVSMPVMDGVAATRKIRSGKSRNCDTPIVALTAHAVEKEENEFIRAGMTSYVAKPVRRNSLLAVISAVLMQNELSEAAPSKRVSDIAELMETGN